MLFFSFHTCPDTVGGKPSGGFMKSPWRGTALTPTWPILTSLCAATVNKVSSDGLCRVGANISLKSSPGHCGQEIALYGKTLKISCFDDYCIWVMYMPAWESIPSSDYFVYARLNFRVFIFMYYWIRHCVGRFSDCLLCHFYYFIALPDNASFSFYYNSLHPLSYMSVFRNRCTWEGEGEFPPSNMTFEFRQIL